MAHQTVTAAAAENRLISLGFGSLLFATIAGVLLATAEFRSGSVSLSAILAGGPRRLLVAKMLASLASGAAFGLVGVIAAGGGTWWWASAHHVPMVWTTSVIQRLAGVFLVSFLAAPWGVTIGWLGRKQLPTVLGIVLWTLAVEPTVVTLTPAVGRWFPGGAQAAIYGDLDSSHFGMLAGIGLFVGWTVLAAALGDLVARRKGLT